MLESPLEALLGDALDRRGFLRGSVGGALLLAVAGAMPAGCRRYPYPPAPPRVLTAKEFAIMAGVGVVILGLERTEDGARVAAAVDGFLSRTEPTVRREVRLILRLFEHGTHLFDLKLRRFTRLEGADRETYVAGWMRSTLGARRMIFRALKTLAMLGYYQRPDTWPSIGYDGPWAGRIDAEPLVTYERAVGCDQLRRG